MKNQYDIFISYSRQDKEFVDLLASKLDSWGYTYWIDVTGIESGDVFKKNIVEAIKASTVVLFVSSKSSNESAWTIKEVNFALRHHKQIIPIRIDATEYSAILQFDLDVLDYVDCTQWTKHLEGFDRVSSALQHYFPGRQVVDKKAESSAHPVKKKPLIGHKESWIIGLCIFITGMIAIGLWLCLRPQPSASIPMQEEAKEISPITYTYNWEDTTATIDVVMYRSNLTSIVIPAYVEYEGTAFRVIGIEDDAFDACFYLADVTIPEGVVSIGLRAFRNCKSLTRITLPQSIQHIGKDAFPEACKITYSGGVPVSNGQGKQQESIKQTVILRNDTSSSDNDLCINRHGRYLSLRIGAGNIFYIYNSTVKDVMYDMGERYIDDIDVIPTSGESRNYAVQLHHSYILRLWQYTEESDYEAGNGYEYRKIYIKNLMHDTHGNVVGVEMEYCKWNPMD